MIKDEIFILGKWVRLLELHCLIESRAPGMPSKRKFQSLFCYLGVIYSHVQGLFLAVPVGITPGVA